MRKKRIAFGCALLCGGLLLPGLALSQQERDEEEQSQTEADRSQPAVTQRRVIDELTVTATRREASLQDVPVSVGVVTGEQIRELSLQNLDQLSAYVPGLSVQEGGEQTGISIRGFGAGLNFGFDQSVGLFIDGIYAGRERQFRGAFLDVSNVEVLRGPQATLFGKNTISGAIIVTTGQPSHEFGLDLFAEATSVIGRQNYQAVLTGGLTDDLAGRLAVRFSDEQGYMRNTFTGEREEQQQDWIARGTLLWTPTDNVSVRTKLERSEYERSGRGFNVSAVSGLAVGRPLATGADVEVNSQLTTYLAYDPNFSVDHLRRSSKQLETADVTSTNAVVTIDYTLPGGGTLRSVTGYSGYESDDQRDVDWTPTNFLYEPIRQEFDQWSQEFQFVSAVGPEFDYILGIHAFRNDFYVDRRTDINIEPYLINFGVEPFSDVIFGEPADVWMRGTMRFLDQQTTSWSGYGSGTYRFNDQWALTAGLRYNWERKEADDRVFLSHFGRHEFLDLHPSVIDFFQSTPLILGLATPEAVAARGELIALAEAAGGDNLKIAAVCGSIAVGQCGQMQGIVQNSRRGSGSATEADWSPEVTLAYDVSPDAMFYGKVTRGHKGGGFNSNATGQDVDPTFEPEQVTGYELGGKLRLLDGAANLNFSIFRLDFDNLQVSVWTGNNFDVGNAGKARSQGLEIDGRWLLTDRLQVNGSAIWLDARYRDFDNAACSVPQLAFGEPGCRTETLPDGGILRVQDLTGKRFAATLSGNVGVGYVADLPYDLEVLLRADAVYNARQRNPRDPTIEQGSRTLVDLGATLRPAGLGSWSLGFLVQNATDREFYWYEFEAPSQTGTRIGFPGPPRRFTLRASYHM
jgi:iron complex outermembrane recepter protein